MQAHTDWFLHSVDLVIVALLLLMTVQNWRCKVRSFHLYCVFDVFIKKMPSNYNKIFIDLEHSVSKKIQTSALTH